MDRLQRRNQRFQSHSASLKPSQPKRGRTLHLPSASRPLPEPSSPDGRQKKKVRFANEAGSNQIGGRPVANIPAATRICDAKTAEFKFFKKLCAQSGKRSHSYKHSRPSVKPNVSKQKQELHNVTLLRKVSARRNTVCCDDPPATPSKNEEIPSEQVNVQTSHSEYEKDTPHLNSDNYVPRIHVFTPIAQTSFEITGISRDIDREPVSGQLFSEKRSKLLKLAAKTVSMGCAELLERRSEFVGGILQRLGANNIIRKQREGSMRNRKIECRQAPAASKGHVDRLLDYKQSEFDPLTTLKTLGQKSSSDESFEFMALPCSYNQSLTDSVDCENGWSLGRGCNEAHECMALPWVIKDIPSSDQNRGIVHKKVSNLLLKDVEPCILGRSASGNELSLNVQSSSYGQHGWSPMLSIPFSESFRDRMPFPYHFEEHHAVPHAISNASWQPDLFSSMKRCISSSIGLDKEGLEDSGWCGNSDAGFSSRFDQLLAKSTASHLLGSGNEVLDHNDFRYISNFHISNSMVLSANTNYPSLMCSTPDHPYELQPMSVQSAHDSAIGVSCLAELSGKHFREVELSDDSDMLLPVLDQLPLLSAFPNDESSIWDHHHLRYITSYPTKDCGNTLFLDANDSGLNSMSSCPEHPCKKDSNNFDDSSIELCPSMHQLQSRTSLGAVLGLMSNESSYRDSGHHGLVLVQSNLNNDILGATDLSFFGSFSAMDNMREAPMLSSDGITW